MSTESNNTNYYENGEILSIQLPDATLDNTNLNQITASVQAPQTVKELNESPTSENVAVTGSLGLMAALLIAISLSPFHRKRH